MKLTTDDLTFLVYPIYAYPTVVQPRDYAFIPTGLYFTEGPKKIHVCLKDNLNFVFARAEYTDDGELVIVIKSKLSRLTRNLDDYPVIAEVILQDPPNGS